MADAVGCKAMEVIAGLAESNGSLLLGG